MASCREIVPDGVTSGNRPQTQGARDCSICYQPMTSEDIKVPRLLTCGHTFCTECIRNIYTISSDAYSYRRRMEREILCPHCKTPCVIPDGDVTKLPKNYILLEIISEQPKIKIDPERITCNIHNIVKKSYCFNCQELVCPYCQMTDHQGHNCEITIEAIKVFLTDFKQHEERLEAYAQQLKSAKDKFQATLYRLKENQREASHHINLRFTAIIEEASKWKNINIRKLDDITKEREDILEQQIDSLNDVIDETEKKLELARRITSPQNEEEFFIHHNDIVKDSKVLISKELGLQPLVHEHIEWRVDPINHIIDFLNRIAFVNEDANPAPVKSPPQSLDPTSDAPAPQSHPMHQPLPQNFLSQSSPQMPFQSTAANNPSIPSRLHSQAGHAYLPIPHTSEGAVSSETPRMAGTNQSKIISKNMYGHIRNQYFEPRSRSLPTVNLEPNVPMYHHPVMGANMAPVPSDLAVTAHQYSHGVPYGAGAGALYDNIPFTQPQIPPGDSAV